MMRDLLSGRVAVVELRRDVVVPLFAAEEAAVASAVPARRQEFMTARECARRALLALDEPVVAIGRGEKGQPLWPPGVVGSLTHCRGYRAAALTTDPAVASVGIDAEPDLPLPPGVLRHVAADAEGRSLERLRLEHPGPNYDRLLFTAKEAVYKAWYPLERSWLGFEDADVLLHPDGRFTARLAKILHIGARDLRDLEGRWTVAQGTLLAAVELEADGGPDVPRQAF